ncbi:MAG: universal stress protein [Myxococcota bacterium]
MAAIRTMLIPIDFSACSMRALATGADLARPLGARAVALHVVHRPSDYGPLERSLFGNKAQNHDYARAAREAAQRELDEFVERQPDEVRSAVEFRLGEGIPYDTIIETARREAFDLIVIGSHGRSGVQRLLMGSVPERVLRHASCPVLVVH